MGLIDAGMDLLLRRKPKPFAPQGTIGTYTIGGYLISPEKSGTLASPTTRYRKYNEMALNIAIVATAVRFTSSLIAGVNWTFEPSEETGREGERIAKLCEKISKNMNCPWYRVVRRMSQFRWVGCSVQEWTAARMDEIEPGLIGIGSVDNRPQITLEQWDLEDQTGYVNGWLQRDPNTGKLWPLSRGKCLFLSDDTLTDSPDGVGLYRHIVKLCDELAQLERLEMVTFETDLRGIPIGWVPSAVLDEAVAKNRMSRAQADEKIKGLNDFITNHIKNPQLGIMLDSGVYTDVDPTKRTPVGTAKQWGIELLKGDANGLAELDVAINRKNREIARVLGVEQFLLGDGKGSHALSSDKTSNLVQIVNSTVSEIAWTLERDWLDPIFALNSWDPKLKPKLKPDPVHMRSVEQIATVLFNLAQAGATIMPNDPVINQIRAMLDLVAQPEISPEMAGIMTGAIIPKDPNKQPAPGQETAQGGGPPKNDGAPAKQPGKAT